MAVFTFIGGALDNPLSWTQPDPQNPVVPGILDSAIIPGGGLLTGSLSVFDVRFDGLAELSGAISALSITIDVGAELTINPGGSLAPLSLSSSESILGTVIQKDG